MDEVNLVEKMLSTWRIEGVQVMPVGGRYGFRSNLEAIMGSSRVDANPLVAVAVLRDADESAAGALQSVRDSLGSVGLAAPQSHGAFVTGSPSVGVFIFPDGNSAGAVEDLCWQAVSDTQAGRCSATYRECLEESEALASKNVSKTLVHAYLAAQEDPATSVGIGAQKGYWPLERCVFKSLKAFLERLACVSH